MGRSWVLLLPPVVPDRVSASRLCVEIVSARPAVANSSYRRTYHPAPYHIVQEIQKFNLSDYRPRQEQYVT
jgi:hypothetical protein